MNEQGNPTRQRWKLQGAEAVTVDFLIPPSRPGDRGGKLRDIEADFAAVITPGLHLAFQDREQVILSGETVFREKASRPLWVCGPGAYVALKALAFDRRGENKDAYDLFYVVRNFGNGIADVASRLRPLAADAAAAEALSVLRRDFLDPEAVGPRRVAEFMTGGPDGVIQADVAGDIREFLQRIE